ncbi:MAG TPA: SlyX family protein [Polyangiaceae bacterium]
MTTPAHDLEKRIVDLELRYMQQERLAHELSDVVAAQQRAIDRLAAEVKILREQILAASADAPLKDERPPHY